MSAYKDIRTKYLEIKDLAEKLKGETEAMKNRVESALNDCLNNMLDNLRESLINNYKEIETDSETKLTLGTDDGVVVVDFDYGNILDADIGIELIFPNILQSGEYAGAKLIGVTDSRIGNEVVYYNSTQKEYILLDLDERLITKIPKEKWEKSPIPNDSWAFRQDK